MSPPQRRQIDQWLDRFAAESDADLHTATTKARQWLDSQVTVVESR
jgi:hypothetical protein